MEVDLRVSASQPVSEVVKFCQRCEEAGLSGVGFVDSQAFLRDVFVVMSHVLQGTERLRVRPAVTCPGPRHTSIVASAAKTVQEFGPGRFELWLGRGGSACFLVGLPSLSLAEMRDSIVKIRDFMAGEWDVYHPSESILKYGAETAVARRSDRIRLFHGGGEPVPVFLTAGGRLNARLAGELCDGVLLHPPVPSGAEIAKLRKWVKEGAAKAGRDASEIDEPLQMEGLVRESHKEAVTAWSPRIVTPLAKASGQAWLEQMGIEYDLTPLKPKLEEAAEKLVGFYPDNNHMQDWGAAVKLAEVIPYELQDAIASRVGVIGDPDEVTARMKELEREGVSHIYLYPAETFSFPEPELRAFKEVIGPAFGLTP